MYSYPCRSPNKIAVHVSIHLYAYKISRTAEWIFNKIVYWEYIRKCQGISVFISSVYMPTHQPAWKTIGLECF